MSRREITPRVKLKAAIQKERLPKWKKHFQNLLGNPPEFTDNPTEKIINSQQDIKLGQFSEKELEKIGGKKAAGMGEMSHRNHDKHWLCKWSSSSHKYTYLSPIVLFSQLHNLEQEAGSIGLRVNANKTEFMSFKQDGSISCLTCKPLKLIDQFKYLSSSISSTVRLSIIW